MLTRRSEVHVVPGSSQRMLEKSRKLNVDCVVRCKSASNHMLFTHPRGYLIPNSSVFLLQFFSPRISSYDADLLNCHCQSILSIHQLALKLNLLPIITAIFDTNLRHTIWKTQLPSQKNLQPDPLSVTFCHIHESLGFANKPFASTLLGLG